MQLIQTAVGLAALLGGVTAGAGGLDTQALRNPVWISRDNLRDPAVLKTDEGYRIFYSRFSARQGQWASPTNWHIAEIFTKDFATFTNGRRFARRLRLARRRRAMARPLAAAVSNLSGQADATGLGRVRQFENVVRAETVFGRGTEFAVERTASRD